MKRIGIRIGIGVGALVVLASVVYIVYTGVSLSGRVAAAYEAAYQESYTNSHPAGYQVGYEEQYPMGYDDGYQDGTEDGHKRGYDEGYQGGMKDGHKEGYDSGYATGNVEGRRRGYDEGHASGMVAGRVKGYDEEYESGMETGRNYALTTYVDLRNPSYAEVKDFLRRDKTDRKRYDVDEYNCTDFSAEVNNNAEAEGIRCALVILIFAEEGCSHAIIAFKPAIETVALNIFTNVVREVEMFYFEPQTDEGANPVVGKRWYKCIEPKRGYYYKRPSYDDTIEEIVVIW